MCARIGIVTRQGLTGVLNRHYPKPLLYGMILLSVPAIVLNIGADIQAMGAVPNIRFDKDYLIILVGILGTTISPYLFFWQTSMEVEEVGKRKNTIMNVYPFDLK